MSKTKLWNPVAIFITDLSDLKQKESLYNHKQYIQYRCKLCNKLHSKPLYRLKKYNYQLLCNTCLQKQTCLETYGVEYVSQANVVKEKIKQTSIEKYGVDNPFKSKEIQEKIRQTCLKKYGVDNPFKCEIFKEKYKQTLMERYGVNNPFKNKQVNEKKKQTFIQYYGTDHPLKNKDLLEKRKQTCLKKYGVSSVSQLPEVQMKVARTMLQKYGNILPMNSQESQERRKQTIHQKYGKNHAPSNKFIYKNVSFDSSWELAVWVWATETGKNITREPISFEYEFEGRKHLYYPDFEIDVQLVEVKGCHFFKEDGTMQNPFNLLDLQPEAKHQCALQHEVQFWSKKEMEPVLQYVKEKYGKGWKTTLSVT